MDCLWSAATSLAKLQTFQRPAVRGQSSRHRRSLFVTAKSGAGAQCRREKPDTSPRPRTACLADDARHSGTPDLFLCPPQAHVEAQSDALSVQRLIFVNICEITQRCLGVDYSHTPRNLAFRAFTS